MNKNEFEKEILEIPERTRYDLVYFILNTFHLTVSNGYWYCYCNNENKKKIKLCTIPTIFFDFESDIDKNMFNISFLNFYHSRLCHELMMKSITDEDQSAIECFLHQEYQFRGRDKTSGET